MELQPSRVYSETSNLIKLPSINPSLRSQLFFTWVQNLLKTGSKTRLESHHAFSLPDSEKISVEDLSVHLKSHNLFKSIILSNKWILILGISLSFCCVALEFSGPVFMKLLMNYISQEEKRLSEGAFLAGVFVVSSLMYPVLLTQKNFYVQICAIRVRNSLFNLIYNQSLQTSGLAEGLGINLLQVDVTKIYEFFWYLPFMITIPVQIVLAVLLVYKEVGNAVWIAIGTIFLAMFSNFLLRSTCTKFYAKIMKLRDERIEHSTLLLTEIKMIKAYSWENYFLEKITTIRDLEVAKMKSLNVLYSCNLFYFWTLPSIVVVVVFAYYTVIMGKEINSEKAFITLTTLFLLQIPLIGLPLIASQLIQLIVSHRRIHMLIDSKPFKPLPRSNEINFQNCSFGYKDKVVLKDFNLKVSQGEFIAIIGPVGSGKSSILQAILGEIPIDSGTLTVPSSIAFAPSLDSWLMSGSIKDNILMGRPFIENWYAQVLEACSLCEDLQSLPSGDLTEIGARGINLSGGQKARVCLARAVYSDQEVYLLDDPLSSVDNHVAHQIFNDCFLKLLKGKTRILVTHQHKCLTQVDRIVELQDGKIRNFIKNMTDEKEKQELFRAEHEMSSSSNEKKTEGKLIVEEDREVGEVSLEVYQGYFKLSGGYFWVSVACCFIGLWMATRMAGDIFLKDWTQHPAQVSFYLSIYVTLRLGGSVFIFLRSIVLSVVMSPKISKNAHFKLMEGFIRAPINLFYDVTPLGRLLNRLTKDINMVDDEISFTVGSVLANISSASACVLMGVLFFPYLVFVVPFILIPGRAVCKYYMKTSRELTRLESISRSPMVSYFKESLDGAKFIRCFQQVESFIRENQEKINENTKLIYSKSGCEQWMRLYLGILSAVFLSALFIAAVVFRNSISVGIVGLTLTYMIPLPESLSELLVSLTNIENEMVSVERIKSLMSLPQERDLVTKQDKNNPEWPKVASISFQKVYLRYRPTTELVLKDLSFQVPGGLRVGITGRTGSGKSSIFLSLLRIVEIESGQISIDGVDISLLGLKKLRQAITLIPQDPLVFNGTIQENIDPFGLIEQAEVQKVLHEVGLGFELDHQVCNKGINFSVGERQLISLSRAMLFNTRIILIDEATAGIDSQGDFKVQKVLKEKFKQATVLIIAHRIQSIFDCDLVIVIDDGKMAEIGTPSELMNLEGDFKRLVTRVE